MNLLKKYLTRRRLIILAIIFIFPLLFISIYFATKKAPAPIETPTPSEIPTALDLETKIGQL
jgi:hypothetical protein